MSDSLIKQWIRYCHQHLSLMDQGLVSCTNFLTGIILVRALGVEGFGQFSLLWIALIFPANFQTALIIFPLMSIGPKIASHELNDYYHAVFWQQVFFSTISGLILAAGIWSTHWWAPDWQIASLAVPGLVVAVFFQLQDFLRRYFFTCEKPLYALLNDGISYIGQFVALLTLMLSIPQLSVESALWAIGITSMLAVVVGVFQTGCPAFHPEIFITTLKRHWRSGAWLTVSNTVQWMGSQGIIGLIGFLLGPTSVGGIRAVINLTSPVNILMLGLQNSFPVQASRVYAEKGHHALIRFLLKATGILTLCLAVICGTIWLFAEPLMNLLYGAEYIPYTPLILWQSLYMILLGVMLPVSIYTRTMEETQKYALCLSAAAPIAVLATYFTIPNLETAAVYVGLIINQLVALLLAFMLFKREQRIRTVTAITGGGSQ